MASWLMELRLVPTFVEQPPKLPQLPNLLKANFIKKNSCHCNFFFFFWILIRCYKNNSICIYNQKSGEINLDQFYYYRAWFLLLYQQFDKSIPLISGFRKYNFNTNIVTVETWTALLIFKLRAQVGAIGSCQL